MSTELLYNGFLSQDHARSIKTSEYQHWVEVSSIPDGMTAEWGERNLLKYTVTRESCMGEEYTAQSHKFMIVGMKFFGFMTNQEKQAFVKSFPSVIVNDEPFKTSF